MRRKKAKFANTNNLVLVGIIAGILFGLGAPQIAVKQKIIGQIFIALLKMLVVPLVFASIFIAIAGLGSLRKLRKIGARTVILYLVTTALSTLLAVIVMNLVKIGRPVSSKGLSFSAGTPLKTFSLNEMLLGFIPTNVFASLTQGAMMQIIVFSILFAVAYLYLSEHHQKLLIDFFTGVNNAMLKMAEWVVQLTPIGVFSLISYVIAEEGIEVILGLWSYMLTVTGTILFHGFITLPLLLLAMGRTNPYRYLLRVKEAVIMAFSTASSAATLPVSMKAAEEKGGVSRESAGFVLPLGATVSMDGTAAYLVIAVLYIANMAGVRLDVNAQIMLGVTVVFLSVGVAALPSASLVMMVLILNQIGLPVSYIALIVAVDRILDMFRTALNVTSDLVVSKIVDQSVRSNAPAQSSA